ncbi:MAG: chromate efflux transporter [Bacteroidota bacterium]
MATVKEATSPILSVRKIRYLIFLKDVIVLACTAFGGPQVHLAMYLDRLVHKRGYLTEDELMELTALCQILPGPTSTQTITAIGFKIGGPNLAYLTLLVWIAPAVLIMTVAGIGISHLPNLNFARFVQPMAVAFVAFAGFKISKGLMRNRLDIVLMLFAMIASYFFRSPWACPLILLVGGSLTAFNYREHKQVPKAPMRIKWANFILFLSVAFGSAILGALTHSQPVLLFENFYRNGSLIFGGGQALTPLLFNEFVHFKHYLSSEEFLSGLALAQIVPGPVFSFTAYIGTLTMRDDGISGQLWGSLMSTAGIFLPGTFLIFFVIRFWEQLKRYRVVRASLEGIKATNTGLVASAAILLFEPMATDGISALIVMATFGLLQFTKIPQPFIILVGLLAGFVI